MLVSGYFDFLTISQKPVWRYPMSYISFHFWALQWVDVRQTRRLIYPRSPGNTFSNTCSRSLMIIVYRVIFFFMIKINEDLTPWVRGYLARKRNEAKEWISPEHDRGSVWSHPIPTLRTYCGRSTEEVK
ncbi:hypothetical protein OSB04_016971 [Centaurea solstitialis]|uniref:Uncharacterized protein n=1 Tax=Centaurea solstitialis TaxID=347529 RepID=A0AA38TD24_9ASTR|nr:hypothetical protein OSB04_016971 [Centaurea solstitialis]